MKSLTGRGRQGLGAVSICSLSTLLTVLKAQYEEALKWKRSDIIYHGAYWLIKDEENKIKYRNLLQGTDWALSARSLIGHLVKSFQNAQSAKCTARTSSKRKRSDIIYHGAYWLIQDEAYKIKCRNLLQGTDWALSARSLIGHLVKSFQNAQSAKCTARTSSKTKK